MTLNKNHPKFALVGFKREVTKDNSMDFFNLLQQSLGISYLISTPYNYEVWSSPELFPFPLTDSVEIISLNENDKEDQNKKFFQNCEQITSGYLSKIPSDGKMIMIIKF